MKKEIKVQIIEYRHRFLITKWDLADFIVLFVIFYLIKFWLDYCFIGGA